MTPVVIAIIQARMQSTRLPAKVMQPLAGKPLIQHVIERSMLITPVQRVILAIPDDDENTPLAELAGHMGIDVFRGSTHNVLERYYLAARQSGGDFIVRVTGDNPFTDHNYAAKTVTTCMEKKADRCTLDGLPLGTAVEVISFDALERSYKEATRPYHFEHVSPYIKEHPGIFTIVHDPSGFSMPFDQLRLTVDTPEDLELAKILYDNLYRGEPFTLEPVISFLRDNPGYINCNSMVKQRPMTSWEGQDG